MAEQQNQSQGAPGATEGAAMRMDHPMPGAGATASHAGGAPEAAAGEQENQARTTSEMGAGNRTGASDERPGQTGRQSTSGGVGSSGASTGSSAQPERRDFSSGSHLLPESLRSWTGDSWMPDMGWLDGPYRVMRGLFDQIGRMAEDIVSNRGWNPPDVGRTPGQSTGRGPGSMIGSSTGMWSPTIEVYERGDEMVISADLPGMSKNHVAIDVEDDAIIIQGERRTSGQSTANGTYRSERSYGHFSRRIPLPPGADTSAVRATFNDGVLEMVIPITDRSNRRRRIDIS